MAKGTVRGDELTPWLIDHAYRQGAFPMTMEDGLVEWFQPLCRALFPIEGIRVSRSLRKVIRQARFEVRFDTDFNAVMRGCLRPDDNWISEEFVRAYGEAHREGWAHCSETWREGKLVGGVYGVQIGSCFQAESMFHRERDASKVALGALVERCRSEGFTLFDAQVMNPHLASLGAFEVSHEEYRALLEAAAAIELPRGKWR